jgi:hypothetical protein
VGLGAEKTGIEKFHDRPQIADVIFDRCAGQRDAIIAFERASGPRLLGFGVLDVLRLIENYARPVDLFEYVEIARDAPSPANPA